jgi:vacuolar-type H+-ATPase subunit D/Vma8
VTFKLQLNFLTPVKVGAPTLLPLLSKKRDPLYTKISDVADDANRLETSFFVEDNKETTGDS